MYAIFFENGIYVAVSQDEREEIEVDSIENLVYDYSTKNDVFLFGGRVHLQMQCDDTASIKVDGINLLHFFLSRETLETEDDFPLETIASYLNQMENLGVNTFLTNYKENLELLKAEFSKQAESVAQELSVQFDEDKSKTLEKIRKSIRALSVLLFSLFVNLNVGLENHVYQEAYNNIINLYF